MTLPTSVGRYELFREMYCPLLQVSQFLSNVDTSLHGVKSQKTTI
jgi:hypothetical protein